MRVPRLLPAREEALGRVPLPPPAAAALAAMEAAVACCDTSPTAPLVVYVSKMVAVPASALPRYPTLPPSGIWALVTSPAQLCPAASCCCVLST